jgi:hypothetical protein
MKLERTANLTLKKITKFAQGDTIYMRKTYSGFDYIYLCNFISYKRGIVKASILICEKSLQGGHERGKEITARLSSCFLWGSDEDDAWDRCHWFTTKDKSVS